MTQFSGNTAPFNAVSPGAGAAGASANISQMGMQQSGLRAQYQQLGQNERFFDEQMNLDQQRLQMDQQMMEQRQDQARRNAALQRLSIRQQMIDRELARAREQAVMNRAGQTETMLEGNFAQYEELRRERQEIERQMGAMSLANRVIGGAFQRDQTLGRVMTTAEEMAVAQRTLLQGLSSSIGNVLRRHFSEEGQEATTEDARREQAAERADRLGREVRRQQEDSGSSMRNSSAAFGGTYAGSPPQRRESARDRLEMERQEEEQLQTVMMQALGADLAEAIAPSAGLDTQGTQILSGFFDAILNGNEEAATSLLGELRENNVNTEVVEAAINLLSGQMGAIEMGALSGLTQAQLAHIVDPENKMSAGIQFSDDVREMLDNREDMASMIREASALARSLRDEEGNFIFNAVYEDGSGEKLAKMMDSLPAILLAVTGDHQDMGGLVSLREALGNPEANDPRAQRIRQTIDEYVGDDAEARSRLLRIVQVQLGEALQSSELAAGTAEAEMAREFLEGSTDLGGMSIEEFESELANIDADITRTNAGRTLTPEQRRQLYADSAIDYDAAEQRADEILEEEGI